MNGLHSILIAFACVVVALSICGAAFGYTNGGDEEHPNPPHAVIPAGNPLTGFITLDGTYSNGTVWQITNSTWNNTNNTEGTPSVDTVNTWIRWNAYLDDSDQANLTWPIDWSVYVTFTWSYAGYNLDYRRATTTNTSTDTVNYATYLIQGYIEGVDLFINSTKLGFDMDQGDGTYTLTLSYTFYSVVGYTYTFTATVPFQLHSGSVYATHLSPWAVLVGGSIGIVLMLAAIPAGTYLIRKDRWLSGVGAIIIIFLIGYSLVNAFILNTWGVP